MPLLELPGQLTQVAAGETRMPADGNDVGVVEVHRQRDVAGVTHHGHPLDLGALLIAGAGDTGPGEIEGLGR